ncbi:MAG: class I SAM-dependent methyltransferase [Candidatus Omnitrophica bacterium]|nr:class I SAM-dependent methyltransferase [Candidatus Omnitrophota bacterium]
MPQNKPQELEHARKILHHPEFYWNSSTGAGYRASVRRAEWIAARAGFSPGQDVLEVGCGTGFFSERFIRSGIHLHAIDLSPELLGRATARCGNQADFRVADIERLPFEKDSFDAVVGARVLHHLDLEAAFKEVTRTLKKGGVIAFCEPNMLNPQIMIQKNVPLIKRLMGDTPDETAFFKWRMRRFLAQNGFGEISVEPFDFLHPWVPNFLVDAVDRIGRHAEKVPFFREIAGSLAIFARKR